jgi:hypothetical protein
MVFPQMIHLFYIFIEQEQVCVESVKTDEFIMAIVHFMIQHFLSKCDEIEFPSCVPTGINITIYLLPNIFSLRNKYSILFTESLLFIANSAIF